MTDPDARVLYLTILRRDLREAERQGRHPVELAAEAKWPHLYADLTDEGPHGEAVPWYINLYDDCGDGDYPIREMADIQLGAPLLAEVEAARKGKLFLPGCYRVTVSAEDAEFLEP